jgi:hypothetical protein
LRTRAYGDSDTMLARIHSAAAQCSSINNTKRAYSSTLFIGSRTIFNLFSDGVTATAVDRWPALQSSVIGTDASSRYAISSSSAGGDYGRVTSTRNQRHCAGEPAIGALTVDVRSVTWVIEVCRADGSIGCNVNAQDVHFCAVLSRREMAPINFVVRSRCRQ